MSANTGNYLTAAKFRLEISGIDEVLFQEVQIPEREIEVATMRRPTDEYDKEIPTKAKLGRMTAKKLVPIGSPDAYLDKWHEDVLKLPRQAYARFAVLVQLAPDEKTPVKSYDLGEIFPTKISVDNHVRMSSDLMYETIEFSVSRMKVISL
ncbi:phage tail protein [Bernardetia sp.]|uniref:phage tail protein n=1 Tax=Bernardetia sp. TaxID=1937974 RepID=UPI0025BC7DF7|nr:phage tail protein [Bernardetia sp.]